MQQTCKPTLPALEVSFFQAISLLCLLSPCPGKILAFQLSSELLLKGTVSVCKGAVLEL